jgi:hypothetical protein
MIFEALSVLAIFILLMTTLIQLVSQNGRLNIIALALQYLASFWLISLLWPFGMAAVKLVVGWMVCAILGSTPLFLHQDANPPQDFPGRLFRVLTAGMVWILVFSIAPIMVTWIPTGMVILWGGLTLLGMGLLQLGMTNQPSRIIIGLLTVMSGFEILYSVLETSVLVAGLLAMVNLGLAFIGSYLISNTIPAESL